MTTHIYLVADKATNKPRLVRASHPSVAVRHVAADAFDVRVATQDDLKWFTFDQNNSGGHFVTDANCAPVVFIQARNAAEAIAIGERFLDNSDSCECCGDRWSFWVDDSDGHDVPTLWGEPFKPEGPFRNEARLHHFDGRIETVKAGA